MKHTKARSKQKTYNGRLITR